MTGPELHPAIQLNHMQRPEKTNSRKKFLLWSTTALSALAILKFIPGLKKKQVKKEGEKVKMLSQDGKLVEIDQRLLSTSGKKASIEELQHWIKK
jgi:hypothetical protein